jgi:hypothetical protein
MQQSALCCVCYVTKCELLRTSVGMRTADSWNRAMETHRYVRCVHVTRDDRGGSDEPGTPTRCNQKQNFNVVLHHNGTGLN